MPANSSFPHYRKINWLKVITLEARKIGPRDLFIFKDQNNL